MRIEDLPRLSDEERDVLDAGYASIAGVPSPDPPAKIDAKSDRITNRLVLGFLSRLRHQRQRRRLARAQAWLEACQCANENHPGLYDALVRDAEQALARLTGQEV